MIGSLPTSLEVGGRSYEIRPSMEVMLSIFEAFNDPELDNHEKAYVCMMNLYADPLSIPYEHYEEAIKQAYWFCGGGNMPKVEQSVKVLDWEQDERIVFPAISHILGVPDIRALPDTHWWTVCGSLGELSPYSLLSAIINIRSKRGEGKKLEKHEQEFYNSNRDIVDISRKLTAEEQAENDFVNSLFEKKESE